MKIPGRGYSALIALIVCFKIAYNLAGHVSEEDFYLEYLESLLAPASQRLTLVNDVPIPTFTDLIGFLADQLKKFKIFKIFDGNDSKDAAAAIKQDFDTGATNEDVNLNIVQLISKYGHAVERHQVTTEDGYVLTMFRIPARGPPVLLMHGLTGSADDWILAGADSGHAYLLASRGYDVWLGNARGNKHSRRHARLSPDSKEFWDFSWEEIGYYDLPAMIDYILDRTGAARLKYVGHSQGTTSFFVLCSMRPEYNDKVSLMVALSAVAWMSRVRSPLVRLAAPLSPVLHRLFLSLGVHELAASGGGTRLLHRLLCARDWLAELVCANGMFLMSGFNNDQTNATNLPVIFAHVPSGAATKQLVHYGQEVVSGQFRRFDHGARGNLQRYGAPEPPPYPVDKITAPVAIFASKADWLANITDVRILEKQLRNVVEFYIVPHEKFNHVDFLFAKDVKSLIFDKIAEVFDKY